jgi:hypothetical protein
MGCWSSGNLKGEEQQITAMHIIDPEPTQTYFFLNYDFLKQKREDYLCFLQRFYGFFLSKITMTAPTTIIAAIMAIAAYIT